MEKSSKYERVKKMSLIKLDLKDEKMMMRLFPLYLKYEAEISHAQIDEIFNKDKPLDNIEYFITYFSRGITTFIYTVDNDFKGFVSFHIDSNEVTGYAEGYRDWGHLAEIYTDHSVRGLGIGKKMVKKVETELSKLSVYKLYLTDLTGNNQFWHSMNYTNTKKIEPNEGGLIFEKYLRIP